MTMSDDDLARATALYRARRLSEAAAGLTSLLAREPRHVEALHLRGVIALESGDMPAALADFRRALEIQPDHPEAHNSLGHALLDDGQAQEALAAFRQSIRLQPTLAMAHDGLGLAFQALGHWRAAVGSHQRAVALRPDDATAWTNLGNALRGTREFADAVVAHARALRLKPDHVPLYVNLGRVLSDAGRFEESIAAYREAQARQPDLGVENDLGAVLRAAGRPAEALTVLEGAVQRRPGDAAALYGLGAARVELGRLAEARPALQAALAAEPRLQAARYALGNVLRDLGDLQGAVREFRAAVDLDPGFADAWSNYLFSLNFLPGESDESLCRANRAWAATLRIPADAPLLTNAPDPERPLTIGYVSSEFRRHHFLAEFLPVLRAHDRSAFRVACYADVAAPDSDTGRVAEASDVFRNLHGLSPAAQMRAVREDAVDILVSLTGYLARDRILFARRIAPLQLTYINHLTATGLSTIDGRITDRWLDPPDHRVADDSEAPIILDSGFSIYEPRHDAPPVERPPALGNGYVTFGSFNNLTKVTDETLVLWSRVLRAIPGARLLIKARDLSHRDIIGAFTERLARAGIDAARCELVGHIVDSRANLAHYGRVDIGLDPVPFAGGATTREMLWAGLPVITLAGATRASRLGASLLQRAGMPELVARSADEYVALAASLASDVPALSRRRAGQRDRLAGSVLFDATAHTRELEAAYRRLWRGWCGTAQRSR